MIRIQCVIYISNKSIWKIYRWSFFIISRVLSNKTNLIFISCIHFETTLTEDPAFTATASMFVINYIGTCSTAVRAITNTLKSCSSPAGMLFCSLFSTHMQGIWHWRSCRKLKLCFPVTRRFGSVQRWLHSSLSFWFSASFFCQV